MSALDPTRADEPEDDFDDHAVDEEQPSFPENAVAGPSSASSATATTIPSISSPSQQSPQVENRDRSPTPPRTLHRSTTGKGIAFTDEDVRYLVRYLSYRRWIVGFPTLIGILWLMLVHFDTRGRDPSLSMPQFWNDLAQKVRIIISFLRNNVLTKSFVIRHLITLGRLG